MSIKVMEMVWSGGPAEATERLVLLAIADNADESGFAYPGIELIARKSCQSERNVMRVLKHLEVGGWLVVKRRSWGESRKANSYMLNLTKLSLSCDTVSPERVSRVAKKRVTNGSGDTLSGDVSGDKTGAVQVTSEHVQVTNPTCSGDKSCIAILKNRHEPSEEPSENPPLPLPGGGDALSEYDERDEWEAVNAFRAKQKPPLPPLPWSEYVQATWAKEPKPTLVGVLLRRDATPEAAAQAVMLELGICVARILPVIRTAIEAEMQRSAMSVGEVKALAVERFAEYTRDAKMLRYTWGPKKFFGEGHWLRPEMWPYDREDLNVARRL